MYEQRHVFPDMLGSLDCMIWAWKNCPVAWRAQYTRGVHGYPTIVLEAVASANLWIWHAFFGVAGSRNDINVLNESSLFNDVWKGNAPEVDFLVNGTQYTKGCYLIYGIYPDSLNGLFSWRVFLVPKIRKEWNSRKDKRHQERMLSEHLMCSKLIGQL